MFRDSSFLDFFGAGDGFSSQKLQRGAGLRNWEGRDSQKLESGGIPENPFAETEGRWSQKAEGSPETGPAQKTRARAAKLSRETLSATVLAQTPGTIIHSNFTFFSTSSEQNKLSRETLAATVLAQTPGQSFPSKSPFFR